MPETVNGARIYYSEPKGKALGHITLHVDADGTISDVHYTRLYLTENITEDREVRARLTSFYKTVAEDPDLRRGAEIPGRSTGKQSGQRLWWFRQNIQRAIRRGIAASPTLLINGTSYTGPIDPMSLARSVCREHPEIAGCGDVPVCGHDGDCARPGQVGGCQEPDTPQARCVFHEPQPVKLIVLNTDDCAYCQTGPTLQYLTELFPGRQVETVSAYSAKGRRLIQTLDLKQFPAYIFDHRITTAARYPQIADALTYKAGKYILSPTWNRVSYLIDSVETAGAFDFFTNSLSPSGVQVAQALVDALDDGFDFSLRYAVEESTGSRDSQREMLRLIPDQNGTATLMASPHKPSFTSILGDSDVEETRWQLCILAHEKPRFTAYLACRNRDIAAGTHAPRDACLAESGIDRHLIQGCLTQESDALLQREARISKALGIRHTPAYLINRKLLLSGVGVDTALRIYREINGAPSP